ncbi:Berberine bridge enzyme-like 22 [Linum perenne]
MLRKYGLAADRVVDAKIVDVNWQNLSHSLHQDIFLHTVIKVGGFDGENRAIQLSFTGLYLGRINQLLPLMNDGFPELGLTADTCGLYRRVLEQETSMLILTPYGGKMSEISDSETPFPHRRGYIYKIQYIVTWDEEEDTQGHMGWIRELYAYITPFVSMCPRAAYYNYRDLDLGRIENSNIGYKHGTIWGWKYFNGNFDRLMKVKTVVDPDNFFNDEQSIPVLSSH